LQSARLVRRVAKHGSLGIRREMAQFIHLFDESDAASIKRGGIRVARTKWRKFSGGFLFPLTENFVVRHQWMRELRRRRGQGLLAARIRLKDAERVALCN
jgi:hypothetical protein